MTTDEITNVETFLKNFAGPDFDVLGITTERNPVVGKLAPKFITTMHLKSKVTGETITTHRNSLQILRFMKKLNRGYAPITSD